MDTIVQEKTFLNFPKEDILTKFAPDALREIENDQTSIPKLAKHDALLRQIDFILPNLPTFHHFHRADAREMAFLKPQSVHLVVTSPPYWTLKKYNDREGQLGDIENYKLFLKELDKVWKQCYEALVPGGTPYMCSRRCLHFSKEKQGQAHCCPSSCIYSRTMSQNWF